MLRAHAFSLSRVLCISHATLLETTAGKLISTTVSFAYCISLGWIHVQHPCVPSHHITALWQVSHTSQAGGFIMEILILIIAFSMVRHCHTTYIQHINQGQVLQISFSSTANMHPVAFPYVTVFICSVTVT